MKKVEINDILQYMFISNLQFSEDGKNLVFVLSRMNEKNNSYDSYLYLYRDNRVRQLTSYGKESSFIFNNDNEIWIFTSREENADKKVSSVYKLLLDGGEAVKAFEIPIPAMKVKKLDDGRLLILSSFDKNHPDYYRMSKKEKAIIDKQYQNDSDYEIIDEVPFYFNGMGFTRNSRRCLYIYDLKKKDLTRITSQKYSVDSYEVIDNRIYYSGNEYEHKQLRNSDIRYYDLKSGKTHTVFPDTCVIYGLSQLNGQLLAMVNTADKHGLNQNAVIYKVDVKNKSLILFNGEDRTYGNSTGSDVRYGGSRILKSVDDKLYFIETRNHRNVLAYFDPDGNVHDVYTADGAIDGFEVCGDKIVLNLLNSDHPEELYLLKDARVRSISHFNDAAIKGKYIALPQKMTVRSAGYDIDGWVLYPKDYDPSRKYPAVLDIHGGPKTVYGEIFYHEMQVWASRGYFVFFCNPFGSDGKGDEFSDMRGRYGTTDYKNIMDFTDAVLKKYRSIDSRRVCVTGGSYGGFMTNWIIGHTDRFVCAATQRSISNWISFIGTSDIGLDFTKDQCAADLNDIDKLWQHSPLKYVNNVKTPTLFIHSDEDYRCPLEQGMQYYSAITDRGIDSRMIIFHGENHELSRSGKPLHRIKRLTEISNWFDKYAENKK